MRIFIFLWLLLAGFQKWKKIALNRSPSCLRRRGRRKRKNFFYFRPMIILMLNAMNGYVWCFPMGPAKFWNGHLIGGPRKSFQGEKNFKPRSEYIFAQTTYTQLKEINVRAGSEKKPVNGVVMGTSPKITNRIKSNRTGYESNRIESVIKSNCPSMQVLCRLIQRVSHFFYFLLLFTCCWQPRRSLVQNKTIIFIFKI